MIYFSHRRGGLGIGYTREPKDTLFKIECKPISYTGIMDRSIHYIVWHYIFQSHLNLGCSISSVEHEFYTVQKYATLSEIPVFQTEQVAYINAYPS